MSDVAPTGYNPTQSNTLPGPLATVAVTLWPTIADVVLRAILGAVTVNVNCRAPKVALLLESAARTRNVYTPAVVGEPLKTPPDDSVPPGGSAPLVFVHTIEPAQHALRAVE